MFRFPDVTLIILNSSYELNRLAYAFRPPVALNRLDYDGKIVTLTTTKRVVLKLTPLDFLAKVTLHIAGRYQNIRRYAGFYSPNIQSRVRRARPEAGQAQAATEEAKPVAPKWAAMIAQIFGEVPVACPKCGTVMDLKEFIFDKTIILKFFAFISRAPPKKQPGDFVPDKDNTRYVRSDDGVSNEDISQLQSETDADFNQEVNW